MLCRSLPSVRSATFTMVVSRIDMIIPRITTPAIRQTCASIRSEAAASEAAALEVAALEVACNPGEEDISIAKL